MEKGKEEECIGVCSWVEKLCDRLESLIESSGEGKTGDGHSKEEREL